MEQMIDCPKCHQWKIKSGDRFCAWCGIKMVNVGIKPEKMRFYIDRTKGKCAHANKIVLDNSSGWTDVKDASIALDRGIFNLSGEVGVIRQGEIETAEMELVEPLTVQPGTSSHIMVEVAGEKQSINVEYYYTPEWIMEWDGETIEADSIQKLYKFSTIPLNKVKFKLLSAKHTVFHIDEIYTEDDRYEVEITERGEDFVEGILKIDNERLEVEMEEYVGLKIKGMHTEFESCFPFYVQLVIPPDFYLMIDGMPYKEGKRKEIEIYEGIENEIDVKIINSSNERLTITGVTCEVPFNNAEIPIAFPKELSAGSDVELKLQLDPATMPAEEMNTTITIRASEIRDKTIEFFIEKKTALEFDGFLAVDFGTTNTTIAYKEPEGKCHFIPLEKMTDKEKAALSPSVIRYEKINGHIPEKYEIGEIAKSLIILNPYSSVMSVKTKLGKKEKIKVSPVDESTESTYFTPLEVTTHIITRLKAICEQHLRRKVSSAVITHPSKFTHLQIEELIKAFQASGIESAKVIEEPEAAALNYIIEQKHERNGTYTIGIFDCGGGTTDITMLSVIDQESNGQRELDVKVLATDGDNNFGGNNLTEVMIEIIADKIKNKQIKINQEGINIDGLKLFYKEEDEINEGMIKIMFPRGVNWEHVVRINRTNLWTRAEKCKIDLSDIEKTEIETFIGLRLVNERDELEPVDVIVKVQKQEFEERINDKIHEMVEKLKRMQEKNEKEFDLVLLSGMSSQIPLILQIFEDSFKPIKIEYASDLKKCVVSGALEYYELQNPFSHLSLKFEEGKKLRSAIGIPVTTTKGRRKFHAIFPHGIHLPTEPVRIQFPPKRRMMLISFKNNGTHEYFKDAPEEFEVIKKFDVMIPEEVSDDQIEDVELYMHLNEDLMPGFSIRLDKFYKEFF